MEGAEEDVDAGFFAGAFDVAAGLDFDFEFGALVALRMLLGGSGFVFDEDVDGCAAFDFDGPSAFAFLADENDTEAGFSSRDLLDPAAASGFDEPLFDFDAAAGVLLGGMMDVSMLR